MRDKSFDFSDGDVLLSAPSNAGGDEAIAVDAEASNSNITLVYSQTPAAVVYFRIHKALLTGHPSMFTDMFEVVNPSLSEQDSYDGVPLIALHDEASHVRGFLRVLSQPDYAAWKKRQWQEPKSFPGGSSPDPEPFIHLVRTTNTSELLRKHLALAFYALLSRRPSTWRTNLLDAEDLNTLVALHDQCVVDNMD
ncbi:hypothetical protein CCMSSC00406_0008584 [Pleurotus cornucopiae]|nr:hypothetical protein CCMSSC00406_0008584 [Pleurotus cornucopiae]